MGRRYRLLLLAALLGGCSAVVPKPPPASPGHIHAEKAPSGKVPQVVENTPFLPPPKPTPEGEKYTVVVNDVPVKELLFALARDAKMNVDIDPKIQGAVTLNAVQQTLPQILERVARQVDLRYTINDGDIEISRDTPYLHTYKVDYVNLSRDTTGTISVATQISTTGNGNISQTGAGGGASGSTGGTAGNNNSTTHVKTISYQRFWETLTQNILAILGQKATAGTSPGEIPSSPSVIPNPDAGLITVDATQRQHKQIQKYLDEVMKNVKRQVMIEATIVEVSLNDQYQTGIDWSILKNTGLNVAQTLTGPAPVNSVSSFVLSYFDKNANGRNISATLKALREFGNLKVLSSPQVMVLNNQTAVLKVVDNVVYFTLQQETNTTQGVVTNTFQTTVHTVPVGFVMTVTPEINQQKVVTLNVRPTISRVTRYVNDPNPALTVDSPIPEIQVREMESVLKVHSGQVAVLGGLMQDQTNRNTNSVPLLARVPVLGDTLFKSRTNQYKKTELVIFLRPVVIQNPSINGDLAAYKTYLPKAPAAANQNTGGGSGQ